jgi:hypothetical protein
MIDHLYSLVFAVCIGLLLSASGLLDRPDAVQASAQVVSP